MYKRQLITLERPDIIPPVAPLLKSIKPLDDKPELTWVNSLSEDVKKHYILRKEKMDSIYTTIASLPKTEETLSSYHDKTASAGHTYIYQLKAEDESGLLSKGSKTMQFKVKSDITEQVKLKKRISAKGVKLTWNIVSEKTVKRIIIYRGLNEGAIQLYDNTEGDEYMDNKVNPEHRYKYAIKAIYSDDSSSSLSKTVEVNL